MQPLFDPTVPADLLHMQKWFAAAITASLQQPEGALAELFVAPSPTLTPKRRLYIYSEQYWWRLFSCLQENFPGLLRLFGYDDFNKTLAEPFLQAHPPDCWSLALLGRLLPRWLQKHYQAPDKKLVRAMALLDWAHLRLFYTEKILRPPPTHLEQKVHLKPLLLHFPYDLVSFRKALLAEEVDYWLTAPFPPLVERAFYVALYREGQQISYCELQRGEQQLLKYLARGDTLAAACDKLEKKGGIAYEEAKEALLAWVAGWIKRGWLYV